MKIKIILSFALLLFAVTNMHAGFPVPKTVENVNVTITADEEAEAVTSPAAGIAGRDMWVAGAFWFFLGGFAAHRWYLGSPVGWNILFIVTLGGLGIWWLVDGINIFTRNWDGL